MAVMPIVRIVILSASILFSVILLGLSAHLHSWEKKWFSHPEAFPALTIATSVLNLLNASAMIVIGITRKGAVPSMIIYEIISLSILSILFLVCGALAADRFKYNWDIDCSRISSILGHHDSLVKQAETACHEYNAITAFAFLTFILLLGYVITLLVMSSIAAFRGRPVWFTSVKEAVFFPPNQGQMAPSGAFAPQFVVAQTTGTPQPGSPTFVPQQQYVQEPMMVASPSPGPGQNIIQHQYSGQYPSHGQNRVSQSGPPQNLAMPHF